MKKIVVDANAVAKHRMIKRELQSARKVLRRHEFYRSSTVGLAAWIVEKYGAQYAN